MTYNLDLGTKEMTGWLVGCVGGLTPLLELRSYHIGGLRTCISWLSHTSTKTTFLSKATATFLTCFCRGISVTSFCSYLFAEVRGKNMSESKFASTEDRTHNYQVMSLTRSPLSHLGGAQKKRPYDKEYTFKYKSSITYSSCSQYKSFFPDRQKNRAKNHMPQIYQCRDIAKQKSDA